jgi:hypothetical protein
MKSMKWSACLSRALSVVFCMLLLMSAGMRETLAQSTPTTMTVQGRLTDGNGTALNGTFDICIRFWSASAAGTKLFGRQYTSVGVNNGVYTIVIGESASAADDTGDGIPAYTALSDLMGSNPANLWMGIKVSTDSEMTPRSRISSIVNSLRVGDATNFLVPQATGTSGYIAGNVGIGVSPSYKLHVASTTAGDRVVYASFSGAAVAGYAGYFSNTATGNSDEYGVYAVASGAGLGSRYGFYGSAAGAEANIGVYGMGAWSGAGTSGTGVRGDGADFGVYGTASRATATGVYGAGYYGVYGDTSLNNGYGGYFRSTSAGAGSIYGVNGLCSGASTGTKYGVRGEASGSTAGTSYGVYGTASGSGTLWAGYFLGNVGLGNGGTASELRFFEPSAGGSEYTAFRAQAQAANVTYTLPAANAAGVLTNDGSGGLTWAAGGGVTGSGTATQVAFWSGASSITGNSNLYWDNINFRLGIGIQTPGEALDVVQRIKTTGSSGTWAGINGIEFNDDRASASARRWAISSGASLVGPLMFRVGTTQTGDPWQNGVTRMAIDSAGNVGIGTQTPGARLNLVDDNATSNGVTDMVYVDHTFSGGFGVSGIGAGLVFRAEDSGGTTENAAKITGVLTDATNTTEAGALGFWTRTGGAVLTEKMRLQPDGTLAVGTTGDGAYQIYAVASSSHDTAVWGGNSNTNAGTNYGTYGQVNGGGGTNHVGAVGVATGANNNWGMLGTASGTGAANYGVEASASGAAGTNYGIKATASGATINWAGYFLGNVGLGNGGTASELRFFEPSAGGSEYTAFRAQAQAANVTYILPAADGTTGQVLSTNGSGALSWATAGSGTVTGSGTDNYIPRWNGTTALENSAMYQTDAGLVGIGTATPSAQLHISGTEGILAQGTFGSGTALTLGGGTRMMWYPRKAAFRAGYVSGTQWNDASIGNYSVAFGSDSTASGAYSAAFGGSGTTASNDYAFASGAGTQATGYASTAMGCGTTTASGTGAVGLGYYATASGIYSFASGAWVTASATDSMVLGQGVDTANRLVNNTASSLMVGFNSTIPTLFVGPSAGAGWSGQVGIGTATPSAKVHIYSGASGWSYDGLYVNHGAAAGSTVFKTYTLYSDGTGGDLVDISNATSSKLRINNSGYVGIGTTSPGSTLDVRGTLRLSGSTSGYVGFAPAAAAGSTTYTLPNADGTTGQVLSTNGSGTLTWSAAGSGTVTGSGTATQVAFWSGASALSGNANLYWDNTNTRLGVGTSSPGYELVVAKDQWAATTTVYVFNAQNTSADAGARLLLENGTDAGTAETSFRVYSRSANGTLAGFAKNNAVFLDTDATQVPASFVIGNQGNAPLHFITSATGRMTILGTGNVGIGTTTPTNLLELYSASGGNIRLAVGNGLSHGLQGFSPGGAQVFSITRQDLFGQGELSLSALQGIGFVPGNGGPSNAYRVYINPSGNVGIGTTSPGTILQLGSGQLSVPSEANAATPEYTFSDDLDTGFYNFGEASNACAFAIDGVMRMQIQPNYLIAGGTAGMLTTVDGTQASPSCTWNQDTNTGFFRAGDDMIGFTTAGGERMRIQADGTLSVGTTSDAASAIYVNTANTVGIDAINTQNNGITIRAGNGASGGTGTHIGIQGYVNGATGTADKWAVQGDASGTAVNNHGIHATASGGTNNYAVHGSTTGAATNEQCAGYFNNTGSCANAFGIWVRADGGTASNYAGWFHTRTDGGYGIYAENGSSGNGTQHGIRGECNGTANASSTRYGGYFKADNGGTCYGVYATATGSSSETVIGVSGNTSGVTRSMAGAFSNSSTVTASQTGVYANCSGSIGTSNKYGVRSLCTGTATNNYGVYADATSATNNYAIYGTTTASTAGCYSGYFVDNTEFKIPDWGTTVPTRSSNGCIGTGYSIFSSVYRIYFRTNATNYYVNSSGAGDYSEYFRTADRSLAIGEVVAMDPDNSNSVRRSRPKDIDAVTGIVSRYGTRNNDDNEGMRGANPDYVNVGMLGQLPVLVTTENGPIAPGDALTLSPTIRGRVTKARGPCQIIGYAMTHFPYVEGEVTYTQDVNGKPEDRLAADHVMCALKPGWYSGTGKDAGDGLETALRRAKEAEARANAAKDSRGN